MNRSIWIAAGAAALLAHAPFAFALLTPPPAVPKVDRPPAPPSLATIDLRTFRAPVTPPRPVRPVMADATRGRRSGGSGPVRPGAPGRHRAIVRLPDRPPEETPAARSVALSEGIAARSDADLAPGGTIVFGQATGGGGGGKGTGTGTGDGSGAGRNFNVNEVDVPPRRVSGSEPSYPRLDALAGREGYVTLKFVVHEDGAVSDVVLQDHQGPASFIEAAREAVVGWRFAAATIGGHRVACICVQRLTFELGRRR